MIKLQIDNQTVEVEPGRTVLEAALQAGIYIPNLCYHPDIPPVSACRLCIVEIEGMRGLPTACSTAAADGMVVRTNTPELQAHRQNIIWFLMTEHPADIITGTQFQQVVEWVGRKDVLPGHTPEKRDLPTAPHEEPLFTRDLERCILCERCVKICQEVRGIGPIGLINRGINTIVGTSFGVPLRDAGCKFCEACVEVCPTGALQENEPFAPHEREKAILPCKNTCPAGIDVARYVRLIAEKRYQDALEVVRERVPLPYTLGCVCAHPCEEACKRGKINEPIGIRPLKKFIAAQDNGRWRDKLDIKADSGKKVAIIGAGPAGLSAAWYLRLAGHAVTIFEAMPEAGGTMRYGIPEYRLPRHILAQEVKEMTDIGVDLQCNTKIESLDDLFGQGFDAIFVGTGTTQGFTMGIPGEDDPRVLDGLSVLWDINLGKEVDLNGHIAVVGGGNSAVDAARTALRVGAKKVTMLYRRTRHEMPAAAEEVEAALHEGIDIQFLVNPTNITAGDSLLHVECIRMELGEPDASGRRRPVPIEGSEFVVDVDRLIMAIGQQPDIPEGFDITLTRRGRIEINDATCGCSQAGVYAGGDVVTGPATVIEAIDGGRKAAASIDTYLGGDGQIDRQFVPDETENPWLGREERFAYRSRVALPEIPVAERFEGMPEVELLLDEADAIKEAERCLHCQLRLTISSVPMPPAQQKEDA